MATPGILRSPLGAKILRSGLRSQDIRSGTGAAIRSACKTEPAGIVWLLPASPNSWEHTGHCDASGLSANGIL
jgi:hypothetical protein